MPTPATPLRASQSAPAGADAFPAGRVFLIGIGGSGMSGLARMLQARGAQVSGCDREPSDATAALEDAGIPVGFDESPGALPRECVGVVASAAVRPDHPMMVEAVQRGLQPMLYAEALGRCMQGRTGIAIAGTHGKSTTTSMLGCALTDAGLDPTVIVGATCPQLANGCLGPAAPSAGFRLGAPAIPLGGWSGRPGLLVAEACEFNRSFHNLRPTIALINNVEADHLDCYGTFDAVIESFREFAGLLPSEAQGGRLLIGHDNAQRGKVTAGLNCRVETIGFSPEADWVVGFDPQTRRVTVKHDRAVVGHWNAQVPGAHNAVNAASAFVLAIGLGADPARVAQSLSRFGGADRRLQLLGERGEPGGAVRVFDDYGHHPTEIDVTLRALREAERPEQRGGRLICVFQPHQHSRTRHLLDEFASSFTQADMVIVPHIYFVRDSEMEKQRVSAADLVERLTDKGVKAIHLDQFGEIVDYLEGAARAGDVVVVMGAGPVWKVGREYLDRAAAQPERKCG
jgi:UDP-N-acetylmuramate--alanine ligase